MLFTLNALAFLCVALMIARRYRDRRRPKPYLENFLETFASAVRYVRYAPGMQVILTRNFLFGLFIAIVPALVPVVALHHLRLQASQLGLVFTSMGIGSLLSATVLLPYARSKATPNMLTILASITLVTVFVFMARDGDPEVSKAEIEFNRVQKVEDQFHWDFDGLDST